MTKNTLPIDIQLFAEPAADGSAADAGAAATGTAENSESKPEGGEPPARYTDKEVDEIIEKRWQRWQKEQEKAVSEAQKLAEMNAQQKAEYERDELQRKLDELTRANGRNEMQGEARRILGESNITVGDEVIAALVMDDAEKTNVAVARFAKAFTAAVDREVKDRLRGAPPKTGAQVKLTKEQIFSIEDREQRQKAIAENIALFQ